MGENKQVDRMIQATKSKDRQNWRKMSGVHCDKCRVRLHNGGSTRKTAGREGSRLYGDCRTYRLPY